MVLQDQAAPQRPANLRRTIIYVVAFALGALAVASGLGFAMVGAAHGILPGPKGAAGSSKVVSAEPDGKEDDAGSSAKSPRKGAVGFGSKGVSRSGKEAPAATKDMSNSDGQ